MTFTKRELDLISDALSHAYENLAQSTYDRRQANEARDESIDTQLVELNAIYQKVRKICRADAEQPRVYIIDGLDPMTSKQLIQSLKDAQKRGVKGVIVDIMPSREAQHGSFEQESE